MYYMDLEYSYTVEQANNVLVFKKNGIIVGEMPTTNYDVEIKLHESHYEIWFHPKNEKKPLMIPKGYSHPKLEKGYYWIEDTRDFKEDRYYQDVKPFLTWKDYKRELIHIDTSLIDVQEYLAYLEKYGYSDITIPDNFWIQPDWRHYCNGWTTLSETLLLVDKFDSENNSMCITKSEACYLTYIRNRGRYIYKEIKDETDKIFKDQPKKIIQNIVFSPYQCNWVAIPNDNWDVLTVNVAKNYLLIGIDEGIDEIASGKEFIHETPVDFHTKRCGMWGIPVIHTTENPVKKKIL